MRGIVGLADLVVLLGDVGGAGLSEEVHPADVVHVGLGGDDGVGGSGRTASKTLLWCGASKPMPVLTMTRPLSVNTM